MKKSSLVTFALIVLLSISMSVQALESKTIERSNGESVFSSFSETNGNMVTDTYLSVTETKDGTEIYVDIYTWDLSDGNYWVEKSGSILTTDDVFSIDKKLNSASLSEVDLEVYDWNTGEIEPLTVKADWTGIGDVSKGSFRSISTDGDYTFRSSDSSSYREASVAGSINGCDFGANSYSNLVKFKSAYVTMEK